MNVIVTSSRNANVEVYHTERCINVRKMNSEIEISKTDAEKRGLTECKECQGESYQEGVEKDMSYYEAAKNAGDD